MKVNPKKLLNDTQQVETLALKAMSLKCLEDIAPSSGGSRGIVRDQPDIADIHRCTDTAALNVRSDVSIEDEGLGAEASTRHHCRDHALAKEETRVPIHRQHIEQGAREVAFNAVCVDVRGDLVKHRERHPWQSEALLQTGVHLDPVEGGVNFHLRDGQLRFGRGLERGASGARWKTAVIWLSEFIVKQYHAQN